MKNTRCKGTHVFLFTIMFKKAFLEERLEGNMQKLPVYIIVIIGDFHHFL